MASLWKLRELAFFAADRLSWVRMVEDVRHFLEAGPFEPFAIVTSSGNRYEIPSADHAGISPRGNRIVIWFDDGGHVTLSALHITAVEKLAGAKNGRT